MNHKLYQKLSVKSVHLNRGYVLPQTGPDRGLLEQADEGSAFISSCFFLISERLRGNALAQRTTRSGRKTELSDLNER